MCGRICINKTRKQHTENINSDTYSWNDFLYTFLGFFSIKDMDIIKQKRFRICKGVLWSLPGVLASDPNLAVLRLVRGGVFLPDLRS